MERNEFEALVAQMEALERADPGAYRRRVMAWAVLGYGYLLMVVLGLLAICVSLVLAITYLKLLAVKLLVVVLPVLFVMLRSLWVKFEPPQGERLTRSDAPALFALLDSLRTKLRTPPVHEVVLTPELNAAVTQVPRLGFLGWHRNFVLLGLPLMKGLTVEQFTAVLAHELGHLSRGHARLGNWIYRLRHIWSRLDAEFTRQGTSSASFICRFFNWYAPRFNATSFPLARANEFEADAAAVRLTSASAAAEALTGINVLGRYLEQKYWPSIHDQAKDQPQPAFAPYSGFAAHSVLDLPPAERTVWQSEALARTTSYADTHPSLTDRLTAIGSAANFAPPGPGQGADTLLGSRLAELERGFDVQWQERVAASWVEFHEDTRKSRERLAELRAQDVQQMQEDSLLEWARCEEQAGEGAERALALRREARERFPDSAVVLFVLGRQLLQSGDMDGRGLLESVMGRDAALDPHAAELLRDHYWFSGDKAAADKWHEQYALAANTMSEARRERDQLLTSDTWLPHGLDAEVLAAMQEKLRSVPQLKRVYLVRKQVRQFPEQPLYVLGYACSRFFEFGNPQRIAAALQEIREVVEFPGETLIVSVEKQNKQFGKLFKRVRGSRIL